MRRFCKYIVTALITFTLGLVCSFLTHGELFSSKYVHEIPAASIDVESSPQLVSSVVAHGLTGDGFETHYFEYHYSNGTYLQQYSTFYRSPWRATAELQKRIQQASEIIRYEPLLDEQGQQIGERVVARFPSQNASDASSAELLWTEYDRLVVQKRNSLTDILHDLYSKR